MRNKMFLRKGIVSALVIGLLTGGPEWNNIARADYNTEYEQYEKVADSIVALVNPQWSDAEKALFLHDELVTRCEYDLDGDGNTFFDALIVGKSKCTGYAAAYQDLLDRVNVESELIWNDEINHEWNVVKIDGVYYHVDTAWDDPVTSIESDKYKSSCRHDFFLLSDSEMEEKTVGKMNHGKGSDWQTTTTRYSYGKADSTVYSHRFWSSTVSRCVNNGKLWFSVHDNRIIGTDFTKEFDKNTVISSVDGKWYKRSEPGCWEECYSCLVCFNNTVYYNTKSEIIAIDSSNATKVVYRINPEMYSKGYIYGLTVGSYGNVCVELGMSPEKKSSTYYVDIFNNVSGCRGESEHNYDIIKQYKGNCIEEGYVIRKCRVCSKEEIVLQGLGDHECKYIGAVKATYFNKGFTGKKVCRLCSCFLGNGNKIRKKKLNAPKMKIKLKGNVAIVKYSKIAQATGVQLRYKEKNGKWISKKRKSKLKQQFAVRISKNISSYKFSVRSYKKKNGKTCYSKWRNK
jgi:hypothetical protein